MKDYFVLTDGKEFIALDIDESKDIFEYAKFTKNIYEATIFEKWHAENILDKPWTVELNEEKIVNFRKRKVKVTMEL
jgi:hypothetical protein